ncbi:MAG: hypothetical protein NXI32_14070 [bacterium]|nr:hypothetical protein [bacterium]
MKNPRRVEAGRRNRALRPPLSVQSKQRLQDAIQRHKPWLKSTGPRTARGKQRVAANGRLSKRAKKPKAQNLLMMAKSLAKSISELRRSCYIDVQQQSLRDGTEVAERLKEVLFGTSLQHSRHLAAELNQMLRTAEESEN